MKIRADAGGGQGENAGDAAGKKSGIELIQRKIDHFLIRNGRRPRVLVSHFGPGNRRHDLNRLATIFARWGFDVDIGPMGQSPYQAALMAVENDVHMVCLLGDPDQQSAVGREVIAALRSYNSDDILVACYGETHADDNQHQSLGPVTGAVGIRPAAADGDIISILNKLSV